MRGAVDPSAILPFDQDPPTLKLFAMSEVIVAEHDDRIVGFAGHIGSYISWLCVHPDHRRERIGATLLRDLLDRLEPPVTLNVGTWNTAARQLYASLGFEVAEEFVGAFNGHDVAVLKLRRGSISE
jgi:ribosomal protein S18 acetylase RimI-like enzyme